MKKKLTFYFDLPEDQEMYDIMIHTEDHYYANLNAKEEIRRQLKYIEINEETEEALEKVLQELQTEDFK